MSFCYGVILHIDLVASHEGIHRNGQNIVRLVQSDDAVHVHAGQQLIQPIVHGHRYRVGGNAVGVGALKAYIGHRAGEGFSFKGIRSYHYRLSHLHLAHIQFINGHLKGQAGQVVDNGQRILAVGIPRDGLSYVVVLGDHLPGDGSFDGVVVIAVLGGLQVVLRRLHALLRLLHRIGIAL